MLVKLQSGFFEQSTENPQTIPNQLDRPVMLVYMGEFDSADGPVTVKEEHIDKVVNEHNSLMAKASRLMLSGQVPLKSCPPLQLDHSRAARDTVGRLIGQLMKGVHTLDDGSKVPAVMGVVRVLGQENVERVLDGRWSSVSIGADFDTGRIQELSITPFPAAADAALLSRKTDTKNSKGESMLAKLKSFLMRTSKLSAEDADKKLAEMPEDEKHKLAEEEKKEHEKLKKYLTGHKKMSEEDAEKHMSGMDEEGKKALSAEADEHEKKMSAEEEEKAKKMAHEESEKAKAQMSQLTAAKEQISKLSSDMRSSIEGARLAQRKVKIHANLSRLRAEAKITPAEIKKIDVAKLAAGNDATVDAVLESYASREPVIPVGILGSKNGVSTNDVYKNAKVSRLEAETRENMPFLAMVSKNRLSDEGTEKDAPFKKENMGDAKKVEAGEGAPVEGKKSELTNMALDLAKNVAMAIDANDATKAKEQLKMLMEHCLKNMGGSSGVGMGADESSADAEVEMSALADSVKTMQNNFDALTSLVNTLIGGNTATQ